MIAFLRNLGDLSVGVKISIAIVGAIVIAGVLVLAFVGVSHEQSEKDPSEEDAL